MHIYIARSIRGDQPTNGRLTLALRTRIKQLGHETQFDIDHEMSRCGLSNDAYIYKRDLFWLDRCQAMIADVTFASHGVGYEIAYAHHVRVIPILVVAQKDSNVSAMLAGNWTVHFYRDTQHLIAFVEQFVESPFAI